MQNDRYRRRHTRYFQDWIKYKGAVTHMWRFFFSHRNAMAHELSIASFAAWSACCRVHDRMTPDGQKILGRYFTTKYDKRNWDHVGTIREIAAEYGLTEHGVQVILDRAIMMVAVERGLADMPASYEVQDTPDNPIRLKSEPEAYKPKSEQGEDA